jgi:hypothetical protein
MRAKDEFFSRLHDINVLNEAAAKDSANSLVYFKSILLLLAAKLEKYVEDSAKEYVDEVLNLSLPAKMLDEPFVESFIALVSPRLTDIKLAKTKSNSRFRDQLKILSSLWDENFVFKKANIVDLDFTSKISRSGSDAIQTCYAKIGLPKITENLTDYRDLSEKISSVDTAVCYDIIDQLNSAIRLRHEIIHNDAEISSITGNDVDRYIAIYRDFVSQIDERLQKNLDNLKAKKSSPPPE